MFSCVGLVCFKSLVGLILLLVVYKLGLHGEKIIEAGILLMKIGLTHFTPVNLEVLTV